MSDYKIDKETIIFEDEYILVANKPAGIPSQGTDNPKKKHFYGLLKEYLNKRENKDVYLAIHHRLDSATSGLILFSKSEELNKDIADLFKNRKIEKTYIALVLKNSEKELPAQWEINNKLKTFNRSRFKISKNDPEGKEAISSFKVMKTNKNSVLLECFPKTGRMHQLRVHLADYKNPIVGDFIYSNMKKNKRLMLHAWKLSFIHPKTSTPTELKTEIPQGF